MSRKASKLFVLSLLAAAPALALADGGGGYNGPVTGGEAIPAKLDRAVTLERLTQVMNGCQVELAKSVLRQASKMDEDTFNAKYTQKIYGPESRWAFTDVATSSPFGAQMSTFGTAVWTSAQAESVAISINIDNSFGSQSWNLNGLVMLRMDGQPVKFDMGKQVKLPRVEFDNTVKDGQTDELGEIIQSTVIIKGLRFVIPDEYEDEVRLVNGSSSLPSALKVSPRAYLDCLYDEIQK